MKRSEMIEKIADELMYRYDETPVEIAEDILRIIEALGMRPPQTVEKSVMPGIEDFKVHKWDRE